MATGSSDGFGHPSTRASTKNVKFCPFLMDYMYEVAARNMYIDNTWEIIKAINAARKTSNLYCLIEGKKFECIVVLNTKKAQTLYKTQFFDFCAFFTINLSTSEDYIIHPDGGRVRVVVL